MIPEQEVYVIPTDTFMERYQSHIYCFNMGEKRKCPISLQRILPDLLPMANKIKKDVTDGE